MELSDSLSIQEIAEEYTKAWNSRAPENVAAFKTENVQKDIVGICVVFLQKFRGDFFGWSSFSDPQLFEISKGVFRENITQELLGLCNRLLL